MYTSWKNDARAKANSLHAAKKHDSAAISYRTARIYRLRELGHDTDRVEYDCCCEVDQAGFFRREDVFTAHEKPYGGLA